jgi:hypothetical protein
MYAAMRSSSGGSTSQQAARQEIFAERPEARENPQARKENQPEKKRMTSLPVKKSVTGKGLEREKERRKDEEKEGLLARIGEASRRRRN